MSTEPFWSKEADKIVWRKKWDTVCEGEMPFAKWFVGGELNVVDTCVVQHAKGARRDKKAIVFENEKGETRSLTYAELHDEVRRMAQQLCQLGVQKGDRIAIYLPLIPKAVVAMLACAYLGATHSVIFGGFSASAFLDRILDAECKVVITADGTYRKGVLIPLQNIVNEALADPRLAFVKHVLVIPNVNPAQEVAPAGTNIEPVAVEAEHPLFILYTSGTTGKPKGILHSTGGYLTQVVSTTKRVFGIQDSDVYWCTADVGWITGHSYVVYGPLALGATVFLYEGAPTYPQTERFYDMIERHRISILYTAPTLIRMLMRDGDEPVRKHDLSSLRLLGSVGEPINPEVWQWYHRVIGNGRCDIVDTWWQTETGAMMVSPIPGATKLVPGSATHPLPGVEIQVIQDDGTVCKANETGFLVITKPWPSMARGIHKDSDRFVKTYFSQFPGYYFTGDGAKLDEAGNLWVIGRVDDVINISGHRLGTAEVESALVTHPLVTEAAVVGCHDDLIGQAVVAFVTLKNEVVSTPALLKEISNTVVEEIGSFARPREIRITQTLPKTRSGKIMRRLLREWAEKGEIKGDTSTLEDAGWNVRTSP